MGRLSVFVVSCAVVLTAFLGVASVSAASVRPQTLGLSVADWLRTFDLAAVDLPENFPSSYGPMGLHPDARVVVMLKLPGDPVALIKARSQDLPPEVREALQADLRSRQDALRPTIESLGGRVLGQYQVAYNGMKIEIARSRLVALASLDAAVEVSPVEAFWPENANGVPLIGSPAAWGGSPNLRGEGIKIAIIDTGIDYTHANFGGPGTEAAYQEAHANETLPANATWFGRAAPKVKGGTDLAGDNYTGESTPWPDPNPLDCQGHGSHVAGTAAGFGVTTAGETYRGPWDADTFSPPGKFDIGPGVAPLADLYAIRVFGCDGFTRLTIDAIEWAVANDMDVINMSLGSPYGRRDNPTAEASDNAAKAGVIVVASAGNSGPSPYVTGAPAAADMAISVAASDGVASTRAAKTNLSTNATIVMQNSNGAPFADGTTIPVKVLRNPDGTVSPGCRPEEYVNVTGTLVVTLRGSCARVARAIYGEKAGAAAVAMINSALGYPPIEDKITRNPDTGERFNVTIPFFGVRGSNRSEIVAADGGTATLTNAAIVNPRFKALATFSSGGPRSGDAVLKPDVTAPGVSTRSTAVGTGNTGIRFSGTSMAAPHVAGVAALVRQAHANWTVADVKAAIVNTGNPSEVVGYTTRRAGTGLVQVVPATTTTAVASGVQPFFSLSFGFGELNQDFSGYATLRIRNHGANATNFNLSATPTPGSSPHTLALNETRVQVSANGTVEVGVVLTVPASTVGNSIRFREVAGLVVLTPDVGQNGDVVLRVPYYFVPRSLSDVEGTVSWDLILPLGVVTLTNPEGVIAGSANFFAWGLEDADEGLGPHDLRAAGVQTFPAPTLENPDRRLLVFAVNTWSRWSNAASNEFHVLLDVTGDGVDDYAIIGFDYGRLATGTPDGRMGAWILNIAKGTLAIDALATAPTDGSTVLLPVYSTRIGVNITNPRFAYHVQSFSLDGAPDDAMPGVAKFHAYTPAITNGVFVPVVPGGTTTVAVAIDLAEWALTPALGFMIVTFDNAAGSREAILLPVG